MTENVDSLSPSTPKPRAPKPLSEVGGRGCSSVCEPASKVPHDPPDYFLKDLWPQTNLILLKAQKEFPLQTQALRLCQHITSEMIPLFVEAVKNGQIKAYNVQKKYGGGMVDLLQGLLIENYWGIRGGVSSLSEEAYRLRDDVRDSAEWLAMAEAIAEAQQMPTAGAADALQRLLPNVMDAELAQSREVPQKTSSHNCFIRKGPVWEISYDGISVHLPHRLGLEYVAMLLRNSGRSISPLELAAMSAVDSLQVQRDKEAIQDYISSDTPDEAPPRDMQDVKDVADRTALAKYQERAAELEKGIGDGREMGHDSEMLAEKITELEEIEKRISADWRPGRRPRQFSDNTEKARVSVTKNINRAIDEIEGVAPETAKHLRNNIQTGFSMIYRDNQTSWQL